MSKQTITPGAWGFSPAGDHKDIDNPFVNIWSDGSDDYIAYDVLPANAQAIAAVPDMIEALQLTHQCLGYMKETRLGAMTPAMLIALDTTIAALRKSGQID